MKRYLYLGIFCVLAIFVAFIASNYQSYDDPSKRKLITKLEPLACDLNKKSCEYIFKKQKVIVSFEPRPVPILEEIELKIDNLGEYKKLWAKVYGLNMYMGTLVPEFKKTNKNYKARLFLSSCILDVMRYRFEFYDDEDPIGFHFDIDIKR